MLGGSVEGKGVRSQLPQRPVGCFAQLNPDPFTFQSCGLVQEADQFRTSARLLQLSQRPILNLANPLARDLED